MVDLRDKSFSNQSSESLSPPIRSPKDPDRNNEVSSSYDPIESDSSFFPSQPTQYQTAPPATPSEPKETQKEAGDQDDVHSDYDIMDTQEDSVVMSSTSPSYPSKLNTQDILSSNFFAPAENADKKNPNTNSENQKNQKNQKNQENQKNSQISVTSESYAENQKNQKKNSESENSVLPENNKNQKNLQNNQNPKTTTTNNNTDAAIPIQSVWKGNTAKHLAPKTKHRWIGALNDEPLDSKVFFAMNEIYSGRQNTDTLMKQIHSDEKTKAQLTVEMAYREALQKVKNRRQLIDQIQRFSVQEKKHYIFHAASSAETTISFKVPKDIMKEHTTDEIIEILNSHLESTVAPALATEVKALTSEIADLKGTIEAQDREVAGVHQNFEPKTPNDHTVMNDRIKKAQKIIQETQPSLKGKLYDFNRKLTVFDYITDIFNKFTYSEELQVFNFFYGTRSAAMLNPVPEGQFPTPSEQQDSYKKLISEMEIPLAATRVESTSRQWFRPIIHEKSDNVVFFDFTIPTDRYAYRENLFKLHLSKMNQNSLFQFFTSAIDIEEFASDPLFFKTITIPGMLLLEDNNIPLHTVEEAEETSTLKIKSHIKHCSNCAVQDHSRFDCPNQTCKICRAKDHTGPDCPYKNLTKSEVNALKKDEYLHHKAEDEIRKKEDKISRLQKLREIETARFNKKVQKLHEGFTEETRRRHTRSPSPDQSNIQTPQKQPPSLLNEGFTEVSRKRHAHSPSPDQPHIQNPQKQPSTNVNLFEKLPMEEDTNEEPESSEPISFTFSVKPPSTPTAKSSHTKKRPKRLPKQKVDSQVLTKSTPQINVSPKTPTQIPTSLTSTPILPISNLTTPLPPIKSTDSSISPHSTQKNPSNHPTSPYPSTPTKLPTQNFTTLLKDPDPLNKYDRDPNPQHSPNSSDISANFEVSQQQQNRKDLEPDPTYVDHSEDEDMAGGSDSTFLQ